MDKNIRAIRIFQLEQELNRLRNPRPMSDFPGFNPEAAKINMEMADWYRDDEDGPGMKKGGKVRGAGRARKGIRPAKMR